MMQQLLLTGLRVALGVSLCRNESIHSDNDIFAADVFHAEGIKKHQSLNFKSLCSSL